MAFPYAMLPVLEPQAPKRAPVRFTVEAKLLAIQHVRAGASKASVARSFRMPESTLRGWCKSEEKLRSAFAEQKRSHLLADGRSDLAAARRLWLSRPQQQPRPRQPTLAEMLLARQQQLAQQMFAAALWTSPHFLQRSQGLATRVADLEPAPPAEPATSAVAQQPELAHSSSGTLGTASTSDAVDLTGPTRQLGGLASPARRGGRRNSRDRRLR